VSYGKIAGALAARGHSVTLLTSAATVTGEYAAAGLPVTEIDYTVSKLAIAGQLRRTFAATRTEVVIADRPRDVRAATLAVLGTRTRLVYRYNSHHGRPPGDLLVRLAYATGVVRETVFQTHAGEADALRRLPLLRGRPTRVVYNGVDVTTFRPDPAAGAAYRARYGLGDAPVVLTVGALTREKRHDETMRAVAELTGVRPRLEICGEGPLERELRAHAASLGIAAGFRGLLTHAALRGAYNAATVYVHSAPSEGFGGAVLEAMACARSAVAPRSSAFPEVVGDDGRAGLLVPPHTPSATTAALAALLDDAAARARIGRAARERAVHAFSLAAMGDGYSRLVEEVAGR
jgi:glycosyltransferase involved in cell wall biosynthesis